MFSNETNDICFIVLVDWQAQGQFITAMSWFSLKMETETTSYSHADFVQLHLNM